MRRTGYKLRLILPAAVYMLVALTATWPLITHMRGWVPGFGDWGQNMWALWWVRQAVLLGQSPFFTDNLFYPEGVTLLFHPLDISDGLLAMPLYGLFGGDITYNIMILLSFVLGGWGAYLLALYLTGHRAGSFVAGLIFVLSPYHLLRIDLGHLNLSTIQWIPFYIVFLLKFVRQGDKRSAALAVFFLAVNGLNSWYYVIYCGLFTLAVLFWPDQPLFISRAVRIFLVLGAAVFILSPIMLPMVQLMSSTVLVGEHNPLRHSVDLFSFFVPGPPSIWSGWFKDVWISYAAQNREPGASAYLGYTVLALSLGGLLINQKRKHKLWWLGLAVGFSLLSLGPQLQIDGQIFNLPLPYKWLADFIPLFSITGIPGRFVVMVSLSLAMLAAYSVADSHNRWPNNMPAPLYLALILLIVMEYLAVPIRMTETDVNSFYYTMAADTAEYSIIDIKWDANFLMHAQTVHGKPLVGGWLARLPKEQATYLEQGGLDKAFLYLLLGADEAKSIDPVAIPSAVQAALNERKVRYIIDHDGVAGQWLEQFIGWPVLYEGDGVTAYINCQLSIVNC